MERFKSEKGMSDEEFESFLDRVYHLCNHVFMGELNDEVLGLLFKGLYYDRDLSCAEREAEVRGRNERIVFEKRERNGDSLPPLRNGGSFEPDSDLSPVFETVAAVACGTCRFLKRGLKQLLNYSNSYVFIVF